MAIAATPASNTAEPLTRCRAAISRVAVSTAEETSTPRRHGGVSGVRPGPAAGSGGVGSGGVGSGGVGSRSHSRSQCPIDRAERPRSASCCHRATSTDCGPAGVGRPPRSMISRSSRSTVSAACASTVEWLNTTTTCRTRSATVTSATRNGHSAAWSNATSPSRPAASRAAPAPSCAPTQTSSGSTPAAAVSWRGAPSTTRTRVRSEPCRPTNAPTARATAGTSAPARADTGTVRRRLRKT